MLIPWLDAFRRWRESRKKPAMPVAPKHEWKFVGDKMYRYRIEDGQIRASATPIGDGWRVMTAQGAVADYIDHNHALKAVEEAYP